MSSCTCVPVERLPAPGYLFNSTLLKVTTYPVKRVDGQAFIVSQESLS